MGASRELYKSENFYRAGSVEAPATRIPITSAPFFFTSDAEPKLLCLTVDFLVVNPHIVQLVPLAMVSQMLGELDFTDARFFRTSAMLESLKRARSRSRCW